MTAPEHKIPEVSVVMAVHNGESQIGDTVDSILNQQHIDLEFIIIDDGSTDDTPRILDELSARDPRIRVVHQANTGLTQALREGCQLATAPLIARQDVGDRSLPNRLHRQRERLLSNPNVVAVGCSVRWIGPLSEHLGDWVRNQSDQETTQELLESGVGFVHPSVMFRRNTYEKTGGYRTQFRFAQDVDLWYRMAEQGCLATCPEILFAYRMDVSGISPENRPRQQRLGELARECYFARSLGTSEESLLDQAVAISQKQTPTGTVTGTGKGSYLIGSQLYDRRDRRCRPYLAAAIRSGTQLLRAAFKYFASFVTCGSIEDISDFA